MKSAVVSPPSTVRRVTALAPLLLAAVALWAAPTPAATVQADRLYGRVRTAEGEVLEGYLRWDRNEASWSDVLDGAKELPWKHLREAEKLDAEYARLRARERSIVVGDLRISWEQDPEDEKLTSPSGIRFGHLASIVPLERGRVRLELKSGATRELVSEGTDLGGGFRGLVVEAAGAEPIELRWRDVERVDFEAVPPGTARPAVGRLFGTLRTRSGRDLTGFVAWDLDEILTSDALDGEADDVDRSVRFGDIAAIERESASAARVVLRSGEELVLRGTNDVSSANRGIEITDPATGRALVPWGAFRSLRFHEPPGTVASYDGFDGGRPLRGVVETAGGESFAGTLRWDNDEAHTWEMLNGFWGDVELAVELALVREIVRVPDHGAEVTLLDGRTLALAASGDVDRGNRGLFVTTSEGDTVLVRWRDLRRVVLDP